jgi:hypothetical protein
VGNINTLDNAYQLFPIHNTIRHCTGSPADLKTCLAIHKKSLTNFVSTATDVPSFILRELSNLIL